MLPAFFGVEESEISPQFVHISIYIGTAEIKWAEFEPVDPITDWTKDWKLRDFFCRSIDLTLWSPHDDCSKLSVELHVTKSRTQFRERECVRRIYTALTA